MSGLSVVKKCKGYIFPSFNSFGFADSYTVVRSANMLQSRVSLVLMLSLAFIPGAIGIGVVAMLKVQGVM